MAKFISLVCNTCGEEAQLMIGALKSTSDFSPENLNSINEKRFVKVTEQLMTHRDKTKCSGKFEFQGTGFAD